jgi:hypothetical protein
MNFVKQFDSSDLLSFELCASQADIETLLARKGVNTNTVSSLIADVYQFATLCDFSLQQKQALVNLTVDLLTQLPSCQTKE